MFNTLKGLYYLSPLAWLIQPEHFYTAWKLMSLTDKEIHDLTKE